MTQDDDLDLMLADNDDSFSSGTVTTPCQVMQYDEVAGQSTAVAGQIVGMGNVLLRASAYPDIKTNDPCTLNDVPYRVAQHKRIQDGRVLLVTLGSADE